MNNYPAGKELRSQNIKKKSENNKKHRTQDFFSPALKKVGAILDLNCSSFRPSFYHNFVSAQYLENKLIEFHQILYAFILTRFALGLFHIIFHTFVPELWSLLYAKIWFSLNTLRTN